MGKESKKGFGEMKESIDRAKESTESLREVMTELLGPILAVAGAFLSIKGIFSTLDAASDKFRELREDAGNFKASLASTFYLTNHPKELDKYLRAYETGQEEAKTGNKNLFGQHLFEEIQGELITRAGLGPSAMTELTAAIPAAVSRM